MNIKFNGTLKIDVTGNKLPKGHSSEAAKQAFQDILSDKNMMVKMEGNIKANIILTEEILKEDE